jgi:hypothetical protein
MSKLDNYLDEAVDNIRKDRKVTQELLEDVYQYISKNEMHHSEVGTIAAKYVETLQRSNEQLVKISSILQKREHHGDNFTIDKEGIYDLIKEAPETKNESK